MPYLARLDYRNQGERGASPLILTLHADVFRDIAIDAYLARMPVLSPLMKATHKLILSIQQRLRKICEDPHISEVKGS
jgi:hypothetical protein